ncbi:MAG TPA: hypothetical protein VNH11_08760 [Pirellulales bacterium]|nr:hypothetical protein [Pirellulales bacterium]
MIQATDRHSTPRGATPGACSADIRMDVPADDWTLDELLDRAAWENQQIGKSRRCSPRYWYYGKSLLLAQSQVGKGGWKAYCTEKEVNLDAWKRGRLLALAFPSPDDVADLTVEAATALARELLGLPARQTKADTKLRRALTLMGKSLQKRLDDFPQVSSTDGLCRRIDNVTRLLRTLDQECTALERRLCQKRLRSAVAKPRRVKRPK